MRTVLGIDLGATFADAVVLRRGKIVFSHSSQTDSFSEKPLAKKLARRKIVPDAVVATGRVFSFRTFKAARANELACIARGAAFLSKSKKFLGASLGTGTALVFFDSRQIVHAGGTGVGGGTLEGLSKLLLGTTAVRGHARALRGKNRLDLTVGDVVGSGIGLAPANATASNFGKAIWASSHSSGAHPNKSDVAFSLFNLVAETVGVTSSLAAQKTGCSRVVFVGRASTFSLLRRRLRVTCGLFGIQPIFVKHAALATAIGAALLAPAPNKNRPAFL